MAPPPAASPLLLLLLRDHTASALRLSAYHRAPPRPQVYGEEGSGATVLAALASPARARLPLLMAQRNKIQMAKTVIASVISPDVPLPALFVSRAPGRLPRLPGWAGCVGRSAAATGRHPAAARHSTLWPRWRASPGSPRCR